MNRSTDICMFSRIINFLLRYVYVTSVLFSSENICGTRPYEWGSV